MADTKITALTALTAADPANDVLPIVDVSDTTMAASGTTKKISVNNILGASGTATLASATITGDLTVDTSTLKVDSANNRVGIGTASPSNSIHLNGASGDTLFRISDSTNGVLGFIGSASGVMTGAPANSLAIRADNGLRFSGQGNAIDMTLSGGNLGLGVTPVAGGGVLQLSSGITFPATQVASTDANTLDDYEEGTFTAGIAFGNASVGVTYSERTAKYTKIGRQVTVCCYLSLTNKGSSTGGATITGLPFTIASDNSNYCAASLWLNAVTFADFPQAYGSINSTQIVLSECTNAGVRTTLTDADFANNSEIIFTLTYNV